MHSKGIFGRAMKNAFRIKIFPSIFEYFENILSCDFWNSEFKLPLIWKARTWLHALANSGPIYTT